MQSGNQTPTQKKKTKTTHQQKRKNPANVKVVLQDARWEKKEPKSGVSEGLERLGKEWGYAENKRKPQSCSGGGKSEQEKNRDENGVGGTEKGGPSMGEKYMRNP